MMRKRGLEIAAAIALILVLGAVGGGFAYVRQLNAAFAEALRRHDGETAYALLRKGVTRVRVPALKGTDRQAIFVAVRSGNPAFVEELLNRGEEVNARRVDGMTPLMAAAASNRPDASRIAGLLLERGADIEVVDADGLTALHHAVNSKSARDLFRSLVSRGADVNHRDKTGRTPLMTAAKLGYPEVVRALLDHGANPDLKNSGGNTALMLARTTPFRKRSIIVLLESYVEKKAR